MPFYVIYARTVNDVGQQVTLTPGTVERVLLEHPGAEHEAMIEAQNSGSLTPGVDYGIKLLQPKGSAAIVCVQRIELSEGMEIGEDGEVDLLGGDGEGKDVDLF